MLMADVALNFATAYLEGRFWVVDRSRIAENSPSRASKSCLWIDAPSAAPFELVELPSRAACSRRPRRALVALRTLQLMRIGRFLTFEWRAYFRVRKYDHAHLYGSTTRSSAGWRA